MLLSFNFDVEAEVAHFRDPTSHAFLNTFLAPPPHTIMGILGNCSGFSYSETEELTDKVKVGCIVLDIRGFLRDLVIFVNQKDKSNTSFPRARKFLVGPRYRIYVACEEESLLSDLRRFVSMPRRIPYLGISDCLAYIRNISHISPASPKTVKDTESIVLLEDDIEYYTKIKEPHKITAYSEAVRSPTSYEITARGRKPKDQKKFLMFVNCRVFLKGALNGYEIDGENVCLV